jgi:polyisoprenoid-binding protein YceI
MKNSLATLTADTALAASPARPADTFGIDKAHSQVTFQVRHLLSKTRGRFNDFEGTILMDEEHPESSSVEFRIRAASVDTDNADRDAHLRTGDFFGAEKHPEIVFKSDRIRRVSKDQYQVAGTLSLRGIDKKLVLPVSYLGAVQDPWGNRKAAFSTEVTLNRKEFGMVWNAALDNGGVVLGDEVWVSIELEVLKQAPAVS